MLCTLWSPSYLPDAVVTKVRRAELVGCLLCCSQTLCRWAAEQRDTKEKKLQQQTSEAEITYQSLVDSADDLRKCSGPQHWMELCIPPPPPLCLPAPSSLSLSLRLCVCVWSWKAHTLRLVHAQRGGLSRWQRGYTAWIFQHRPPPPQHHHHPSSPLCL